MRAAGGVEHGQRFGLAVGLPDVFHAEHGEHHALGVAQSDLAAAGRQFLGEIFRDIQRDRHGPKRAVGQPHVLTHAFIVGAVHEPTQRGEPAAHQQFQVAKLPRRQVPRRPVFRMRF